MIGSVGVHTLESVCIHNHCRTGARDSVAVYERLGMKLSWLWYHWSTSTGVKANHQAKWLWQSATDFTLKWTERTWFLFVVDFSFRYSGARENHFLRIISPFWGRGVYALAYDKFVLLNGAWKVKLHHQGTYDQPSLRNGVTYRYMLFAVMAVWINSEPLTSTKIEVWSRLVRGKWTCKRNWVNIAIVVSKKTGKAFSFNSCKGFKFKEVYV